MTRYYQISYLNILFVLLALSLSLQGLSREVHSSFVEFIPNAQTEVYYLFLPITTISPPNISRISIASDGTEGNSGSMESPAISANGRYIAFQSYATNLVENDTNCPPDKFCRDIFVHDRQTGQTQRVSVNSAGVEGNGESQNPSISADGRYVVFSSYASNLVDGDTNNSQDIFVHDLQTRQTSRVSVDSNGIAGNDHSAQPAISADGRYVAFTSSANNLVHDDNNDYTDIFVHDRQTGQTNHVSVDSNQVAGNNFSSQPALSVDGRYVVFTSDASNLVNHDTNGHADVFVHDRQTGQTQRVSVASDGTEGNDSSLQPAISADGRYVCFESYATNLLSTPALPHEVYVYDLQTGQVRHVSVASNGTAGNWAAGSCSLSANGRYVAFASFSTNLVSDDTNHAYDIFVYDQQTRQTRRVSVASDGTEGNDFSQWPSISADGRFVTFTSYASNLVEDDTNDELDIFVKFLGDS